MIFIDYDKFNKDVTHLAQIISTTNSTMTTTTSRDNVVSIVERKIITGKEFKYTSIYPVSRGGIPVATALASLLHLPIVTNANNSFTLVVDDLVDSGKTRLKYISNDFACLYSKLLVIGSPDFCSTYYVQHMDEGIEFWWEQLTHEHPVEDAVIRMLQYIGEDPSREGLVETPKRVLKAYDFMFSGYKKNIKSIFKVFDSPDNYDEIVLLKDVEMYSTCEHHWLPVIGKAHIAYIPKKKVVGVSKLARLLEVFSRRLQIQERICQQVTNAIMENLDAKAAACIIEAKHLCMSARGVEKQNSLMVTSSLKGQFLTNASSRQELFNLIK